MAQLMIVLDVTIVNVALPGDPGRPRASAADLTWVVNGFLITFGSLLLLAGRLGKLAGRKRVFLGGLVVFTAASLLCGIGSVAGPAGRRPLPAGMGAAAQASVILAIIVAEVPDPAERARAMGAYVFVSVAGGSLGLLAGGPVDAGIELALGLPRQHPDRNRGDAGRRPSAVNADEGLGLEHAVDKISRSALVTASLMTGIYAIVEVTSPAGDRARCLDSAGSRKLLVGGVPGGGGAHGRTRRPCGFLQVSATPISTKASDRGFLVIRDELGPS